MNSSVKNADYASRETSYRDKNWKVLKESYLKGWFILKWVGTRGAEVSRYKISKLRVRKGEARRWPGRRERQNESRSLWQSRDSFLKLHKVAVCARVCVSEFRVNLVNGSEWTKSLISKFRFFFTTLNFDSSWSQNDGRHKSQHWCFSLVLKDGKTRIGLLMILYFFYSVDCIMYILFFIRYILPDTLSCPLEQ